MLATPVFWVASASSSPASRRSCPSSRPRRSPTWSTAGAPCCSAASRRSGTGPDGGTRSARALVLRCPAPGPPRARPSRTPRAGRGLIHGHRPRDPGPRRAWRTYPTGLARAAEVLSLGALRTHRPYWALRDVSLSLPRGAALGVVGANGAGRAPSSSSSQEPPLRPRAGCAWAAAWPLCWSSAQASTPSLSGRENALTTGVLLGRSRREMRACMDELLEFAGVHRGRRPSSHVVLRHGHAPGLRHRALRRARGDDPRRGPRRGGPRLPEEVRRRSRRLPTQRREPGAGQPQPLRRPPDLRRGGLAP